MSTLLRDGPVPRLRGEVTPPQTRTKLQHRPPKKKRQRWYRGWIPSLEKDGCALHQIQYNGSRLVSPPVAQLFSCETLYDERVKNTLRFSHRLPFVTCRKDVARHFLLLGRSSPGQISPLGRPPVLSAFLDGASATAGEWRAKRVYGRVLDLLMGYRELQFLPPLVELF